MQKQMEYRKTRQMLSLIVVDITKKSKRDYGMIVMKLLRKNLAESFEMTGYDGQGSRANIHAVGVITEKLSRWIDVSKIQTVRNGRMIEIRVFFSRSADFFIKFLENKDKARAKKNARDAYKDLVASPSEMERREKPDP